MRNDHHEYDVEGAGHGVRPWSTAVDVLRIAGAALFFLLAFIVMTINRAYKKALRWVK